MDFLSCSPQGVKLMTMISMEQEAAPTALPTTFGKHSGSLATGAPALDLAKRYVLFRGFVNRLGGSSRLHKSMLQECHQEGYGPAASANGR